MTSIQGIAVLNGRIKHSLLAIGLIALVVVASPLKAESPRDKAGFGSASGGDARRAMCPANNILVSLWTVVDADSLKSTQIECAPLSSTGVVGLGDARTRRGIVRGKGFRLDDDSIFENLHKMPCSKDAFVTGINPGVTTVSIDGSGVQVPWHSLAICRNLVDDRISEQSYAIPPAKDSGTRLLGFDGIGGARSCAANEVGVGVWGRINENYVLTLGMVCALLSDVRPLTPAQRGVDRVGKPDPTRPTQRVRPPGVAHEEKSQSKRRLPKHQEN